MKLSDFYGEGKEITVLTMANIDDVIWLAIGCLPEKIEVTGKEMGILFSFYVAVIMDNQAKKADILENGISKIFGVPLELIAQ